MDELLDVMVKQSSPREAKQHLANYLGVSYQAVKKWFDRGYLPIDRAIECEMHFGVDRLKLIDPRLVDATDKTVF